MVKMYQVDAFADSAFAGNPAAVCLLEQRADDQWMQNVAAEMNLSETAFVLPQNGEFQLRWYTPTVEVDLCGHATLASSHILWETGRLSMDQSARFHSRSGVLSAKRTGEMIQLDFPSTPATACAAPGDLIRAIGCEPVWCGANQFDYLLQLPGEADVRNAQPDFPALRELGVRGVIVTAKSTGGPFDFVSRFFAPGAGIDEDPVTGSAHCTLGPFWAHALGRGTLVGFQASRRGGIVHVTVAGDRVHLGGHAVTVMQGDFVA